MGNANNIIVGIDLGTTYSELAVYQNGKPMVIGDMLPSCVGIDDHGKIIVGRIPLNQAVVYPDRVIRSIKRQMGSSEVIMLGGQQYTPQQISAEILKTLKHRAESYLNQTITQAVITVPAYFDESQRRATREAGELAGFDVKRILHEPTAAALCYHSNEDKPSIVLVYDLGGGTFDVSILKCESGVIEVLASFGNTHLGGDDFDALITAHLREVFEKKNRLAFPDDPIAHNRLVRAAEKAKIELSSNPFTTIREEHLCTLNGKSYHFEYELSREQFNTMINGLIEDTLKSVNHAMKDAELLVRDIDTIILAGGSTRIPLIGDRLEELFDLPVSLAMDPDLCVVSGAAIHAASLAGENVQKLLLEITPHSLGVECLERGMGMYIPGRFSRIIKRGSKVPTSASEVYFTSMDNQEKVKIKVYQGESDWTEDNVLLGDFYIEGLSKRPEGNPILFHLSLNLDGILTATATEKATGLSKRVVIRDALSHGVRDALPDKDVREKRPRDPEKKSGKVSQIQSIKIKTDALMEKAKTILPDLSAEDAEDVQDLINELENLMQDSASTDPDRMEEIQSLGDELANVLFYLQK